MAQVTYHTQKASYRRPSKLNLFLVLYNSVFFFFFFFFFGVKFCYLGCLGEGRGEEQEEVEAMEELIRRVWIISEEG